MQDNLNRKFLYVSLGIVLVASVFLSGVYLGFQNRPEVSKITSLLGKEDKMPAGVDFSPFWETWTALNNKFVESADAEVSDQDKVWGAIQGLVASYKDPYTVFMPPVQAKQFEEEISGNFSGVGMEIGIKDDVLTVITPLKGTPAERAGIKAGDKILRIDDKNTDGLSVDEAVRLIRGEQGTTVGLTILAKGTDKPKEISVVRQVITIPTIETETKGDIFVIKLYNFSAVSPNLFRGALREFVESGKNKLILDLRGNPGGYLDAAIDMASFFLPAGKTVVREDFGGNRSEEAYRSKGYNVFNDSLRMIILVNEGSASASEILAGALQEHNIAKLVGQTTFGKGSVQEVIKITPETSLKVTIARWLTPNGISISKQGLKPDYEVTASTEPGEDAQMDKAIQLLK